MAHVSAGLDHDHPHPGPPGALMRMFHQRSPNAFALMRGIDTQDVDLAHGVLGVDSGADPPGDLVVDERDVAVSRFFVEDQGEVCSLTNIPSIRVEGVIHETRHESAVEVIAHRLENRFPRANRHIENLLTHRGFVGHDSHVGSSHTAEPTVVRIPPASGGRRAGPRD